MFYSYIFFFCALFIRITFIVLQDLSPAKLIEDEWLYWSNSISYLDYGHIEESILTERMPGVFIYFKLLLFLSFKSFKFLLCLQAIVDSLSCVVIYKIGKITFPKQSFYIFLTAMLSPLMIIMSSQILSETIFLFFFSLFLYFSVKAIVKGNNLYLNMALAGLFLGISTSIRSITFPLIFLSVIPIVIIFFYKKILKNKILFASFIFLFFSMLPISSRILNNFKLYDTLSLTSQTGTHLAYWVTPIILSETKNINRSDALSIVNEAKKKYLLHSNPYKNDLVLRKVSFEVLSNINTIDIVYQWSKGGLINLIAPSFLLDKTVRSFPHPSYYETGNLLEWLKLLTNNKEYYKYFIIISLASITSIFSLFSIIVGPFLILKQNKMFFCITLLYVFYFLTVTGPVLSPKYIFPILPCIFLYQGVTLFKITEILKKLIKKL